VLVICAALTILFCSANPIAWAKAFSQLIKQAARWKECQVIREYINQKESDALRDGNLTEQMIAWLKWARDKVDWYDPMIDSLDEWLKDVSPDNIHNENLPDKTDNPWLSRKDENLKSDRDWPVKAWYLKQD
jgi:hypothetical protein